ncbi:MAG: hypothetical protein Q8P51_14650 [Ignavibacteria bacterium]|nr:hypothetical protein [Ignavibacteria bacterium]
MAKAKRVAYFKAKIEDKPGALLALAKDLKEKKLDLISLKGFGHAGQGEILVIAKRPEKLRDAWKATGALTEEGVAFFLSGADKTGALVAGLDAIANAGVNLVAIEALAVGGKFGAVLWVAPGDLDKTAQVLGAK